MSKALITGITGQDASYLTELLLSKGYEVHATYRRTSKQNFSNVKNIIDKLKLHSATLENYGSIYKVVNKVKPDEVYHLAAQSYVANSFEDEFSTMSTNIHGTHYILNSVKEICPHSKFYFAGTSEMFGNAPEPQNEQTPMHPVSPYGISKLACLNLCHYYKRAYQMFIACGILFNHESPRRGDEFVTKKITNAAKKKLIVRLGNLEARRDWGYAGDYVKAMWMMLQHHEPDDFVIATGETHSVKDFCKEAYGEKWSDYVEVDQEFYRPNELHVLRGDSSKAYAVLGWKPTVSFKQLVRMMMDENN
jgi:GDPmannose 4,6-dehydratase